MRRRRELTTFWVALLPCCRIELCEPPPRPEDPTECVGTREELGPADDCDADAFEPNDDLTLASPPVAARECRGATRSGILAGDGDVDVFHTRDCDLADEADPWAELQMTGEGSEALRLCIFPVCLDGSTNVHDCYASSPSDSNTGEGAEAWMTHSQSRFRGCCRTGNGKVSAQVHCDARGKKVDTYVWIDAGSVSLGDPQCRGYEVAFEVP